MDNNLETGSTQMIQETTAVQNGDLPPGNTVVETSAPITVPLVDAVSDPSPVGEEVEVDGQKFVNEAAAFKFLKGKYGELEQANMITEARAQGMQDALYNVPQPVASAPVPTEEPYDEDAYYADPIGYAKKREAQLAERLNREWSTKQASMQQDADTWNNFTNQHPDLADFKTDVEEVVSQHMQTVSLLAKRDQKKAMDFVALKVREKFQRWVEAAKPTRVLSNSKAATPDGGNPSVTDSTKTPDDDKPVDFVTQLKNRRR